jgi:hypothetical protein
MTAVLSPRPSFPRKRESMWTLGNVETDARFCADAVAETASFRAEGQS